MANSSTTGHRDMSTAVLIRVDQSGEGDFTKIQDAIDSVPSNNSALVFIWVKPGTYREKIVVPADKPFITLSGTLASTTVITWNDGGDVLSDSPTVKVSASDFVGRYLTFQIFCCLIMANSSTTGHRDMSTAILIRVDQSGKGDFTKIQDAIDSVPSNNSALVFIWVKPGTYREKIVVPADKPFITLSGTLASTTIITWNDGGDVLSGSPTVKVSASDFVGRYLTFQNTYGKKGKGVALSVTGDRAAFYGCRILSYQDTLLDDAGRHYYKNCYIEGATDFIFGNAASLFENTYGKKGKGVALSVTGDRVAFYGCRILSYQDTLLDDAGRHYYKNCYIEGATDFIFGNAASLFERCRLHSISGGNGAITAQKREFPTENTGFVFLGCKITGNGNGSALLGRPWGSYSRVVFALSYMSSVVQSEGWNDWGDQNKQSSVYYGEYKCYGPGANRAKRVNWSHNLSNEEASLFLNKNMIGGRGWLRPAPTRFKRGSTILKKPN
ncbi:unnamed protein product [Fraxinus pennsylvanica]|uniref:Pectinesterase n=1 Tax=Fraxinus pennsylvanica TaxID=56036 RepID=A0AAD2DW69_9LAMI|nr:unnamed protein product [Fraxinus pennsylvanica]